MTLVESVRAALDRHPGIRVALVFGSQARGSADAGSDVDIAVGGTGVDLLELRRDLSLTLGKEVDILDLARAGYPLLKTLVREGETVFEATPGAGAQWRSRAICQLETDRPWFERMRDSYLDRLTESRDG